MQSWSLRSYQPKFLHISLSWNTWTLVLIFRISRRDEFMRIKGFHIDHCCCLFVNFLKCSITFRSKPSWGSSCLRGEDGMMGENFKIQGVSHLDKCNSSRDQEKKKKLHLTVHSCNVYLGIWGSQQITWAWIVHSLLKCINSYPEALAL